MKCIGLQKPEYHTILQTEYHIDLACVNLNHLYLRFFLYQAGSLFI